MGLSNCGCGGMIALGSCDSQKCDRCGRLFAMQDPPKRHILIIPTTQALLALMRELDALGRASDFRVSTPIQIDAGALGCETRDRL